MDPRSNQHSPPWAGIAVGLTAGVVAYLFQENTWDTVARCVLLAVVVVVGFEGAQRLGDRLVGRKRPNS